MVDVSKMNADQLNELMTQCRARQYELRKEYIATVRVDAMKNVGRCFRSGDDLVKIIGIPQAELTKTGIWFNQYQYPSIQLSRGSELSGDQDPLPIHYDTQFSGIWGDRHGLFCETYQEIDPAEFIEEYKRRMDEFMLNYITDVVRGVNCEG